MIIYTATTALSLIDGCSFGQVEAQCKQHSWDEQKAKPVDFTLYMESLCPDCKAFIKSQLAPAYAAVGHIMNLTLVPYGNAMVSLTFWQVCRHLRYILSY